MSELEVNDETKERLKQFLLDYIRLCIKHNMHLEMIYSEIPSEVALSIMYSTNPQWNILTDGFETFIDIIEGILEEEKIPSILSDILERIDDENTYSYT